MNWYGKSFLEASVGDTIRKLCSESVAIEVDPIRNGKGAREVERHVDLLVHWCREVWEKIYAARYGCPQSVYPPALRYMDEKAELTLIGFGLV